MAYMEKKTANHIISAKFEADLRRIEAKKLASVKATLNTRPVPKPSHAKRNAKKEMMLEGEEAALSGSKTAQNTKLLLMLLPRDLHATDTIFLHFLCIYSILQPDMRR